MLKKVSLLCPYRPVTYDGSYSIYKRLLKREQRNPKSLRSEPKFHNYNYYIQILLSEKSRKNNQENDEDIKNINDTIVDDIILPMMIIVINRIIIIIILLITIVILNDSTVDNIIATIR